MHGYRTDPAGLGDVLDLACRLRDRDRPGALHAARRVLAAAGDPILALYAAAAAVNVDRPLDRWWADPYAVDDPEPVRAVPARLCEVCGEPIPEPVGRRAYCPPPKRCKTAAKLRQQRESYVPRQKAAS